MFLGGGTGPWQICSLEAVMPLARQWAVGRKPHVLAAWSFSHPGHLILLLFLSVRKLFTPRKSFIPD